MIKTLNGKVALVTGAEGEMGAAVASRLANEGALVVAGVRREEAGRTSPENDPGSGPRSHDVIELDGGEPDAVARAVPGIVERHGSLDIVINAAGSMPSQALARPGPGNKQPDGKQLDDKQKSDKHGDGKDGSGTKPDGEASDKKPMPRGKRIIYGIAGLLALGALVTAGVLYWLQSRHYETTDDAYVDGNISQVAAQIGGRVTRIAFQDNQEVHAGQVLLELDPRDLQVKLDQAVSQRTQAEAQATQARAQLSLQQAKLDQAQANVRVTAAELGQAQADLARYRAIDPKAITRQQLDNQGAATKSAGAKLDANRQAVAGARAQIEAQRATVAAQDAAQQQAEVMVRNAQLQLSYTTVLAPTDGQVTRRTVELGNYVNPGQSLLAVVQDRLWITANFKETQLAAMSPGQYVRVRVDACPDADLDAKVTSFQGGSGQVFSSLPAENATGNFVKVVQRLPVRITFDDPAGARTRCRMAPGMSVSPRVTVR
jgi:membrane fusion protein, multidrug efflux system